MIKVHCTFICDVWLQVPNLIYAECIRIPQQCGHVVSNCNRQQAWFWLRVLCQTLCVIPQKVELVERFLFFVWWVNVLYRQSFT